MKLAIVLTLLNLSFYLSLAITHMALRQSSYLRKDFHWFYCTHVGILGSFLPGT